MHKARTIGIWLTGLIGFGLLGAAIGNLADRIDGGGGGLIAGICIFTCARLWLSEPKD